MWIIKREYPLRKAAPQHFTASMSGIGCEADI